MIPKVPPNLNWTATQLAMNSYGQQTQVGQSYEIQNSGLEYLNQEQEEELMIDNQKDHDFQIEFKKMTDLSYCTQNQQRIQNQKDKKDKSISQISESQNQSFILPSEIKQNKQQIQAFGDRKLFLNVKGEGFQEFKIRSFQFKLHCPSCQEFLPSSCNKLNLTILQFKADCKKCSQQMSIEFQKHIVQMTENPSEWFIGSIKTQKNAEFQLNSIEVTAICKCLSQSSRLPYQIISFEKKDKIISSNQRLKCLLTDQSRQLCHGCVQELKFQPAWLIIKS